MVAFRHVAIAARFGALRVSRSPAEAGAEGFRGARSGRNETVRSAVWHVNDTSYATYGVPVTPRWPVHDNSGQFTARDLVSCCATAGDHLDLLSQGPCKHTLFRSMCRGLPVAAGG